MQRPRHLLALAAAALVAAGCHDRQPRPSMYGPGSESELLQSEGKRSIVRTPDGDSALKLRVRDDGRWDVFDADMNFAGQVGHDDVIEIRTTRTGDWQKAQRRGEAWEIPGVVRAEALHDGWTVFDAQNEVVGYLRVVDNGWERRDLFDGEYTWRSVSGELRQSGSTEHHTVTGASAGDGVLIMTTLDGVELLGLVALGRFIDSEPGREMVRNVAELAEKNAAHRGRLDAGVSDESADAGPAQDSADL